MKGLQLINYALLFKGGQPEIASPRQDSGPPIFQLTSDPFFEYVRAATGDAELGFPGWDRRIDKGSEVGYPDKGIGKGVMGR